MADFIIRDESADAIVRKPIGKKLKALRVYKYSPDSANIQIISRGQTTQLHNKNNKDHDVISSIRFDKKQLDLFIEWLQEFRSTEF